MSTDSADALKSGLSVFSRLFDHRAIVQGECRYFIDEFQNKRKGLEERRISECKEILAKQTQDSILIDLHTLEANLNKLDEQVLALTELCDMILPDEIMPAEVAEHPVSRAPSPGHDTDWDNFMAEVMEERRLIDQLFNNEIEQFKIYLSRQTPPSSVYSVQ